MGGDLTPYESHQHEEMESRVDCICLPEVKTCQSYVITLASTPSSSPH